MTETVELSTPLAVPSCLMELLQLDLGAGLELQPCLANSHSCVEAPSDFATKQLLRTNWKIFLDRTRSCLSSMVRSGSGLWWTVSATSPCSQPLVLLCYIHIYLSLAFRITPHFIWQYSHMFSTQGIYYIQCCGAKTICFCSSICSDFEQNFSSGGGSNLTFLVPVGTAFKLRDEFPWFF